MKAKIYILAIFGLFSLSNTIFAQELTVKGTLVNAQKEPMPYGSVILTNRKNNFTGTSTDDNGAFIITNLKAEAYTLRASFVGFESYTKDIELIEDTTLKPIVLIESTETLNEVSIIYKKPTLKKEVDRLVFNVANTALSEGSTLDVLKSTPGVIVLDDIIKVRNKQPTIYINDRKINLSASDIALLLKNAPANTIQKIEVITNPSSKYDAESGVVINIVMIKNLIAGYNGSVFSNYTQGKFPRYSLGTANFFKTKKINLFANYNYSRKKINRESKKLINYQTNGTLNEQWISNFNRNTTSENHNLSFNFDYDINDQNTLSITSNVLYLPYFKYITKGKTKVLDAFNTLDFTLNSNNLSRDEKINVGVDLDYVHRFKNKAKLSLNAHYTDYDYLRDQALNSNYFLANNSFDFSTAFNTDINQNANIKSTKLDYELPINENTVFSMGAKSSSIKTKNDIVQFDIDPNTGSQTINPNNSNRFLYDENILAGYISLDKKWEKWSLSGGLRAEQTKIEGVSENTNEINKQNYLKWFPTFNLSLQANEKVFLYSNYKRSITRPSYEFLNPFNFFLNDNTIVSGNPNLQPSFTDYLTLGTTLLNRYTIEAFYSKINANFYELPIQNNANNTIRFTPTNLNDTEEFGVYFLGAFDILKNWSFNFLSAAIHTRDDGIFNQNTIKRELWSGYFQANNSFKFLKDKSFTANLSVFFIDKVLEGFKESDPRIDTSLSFRKTVLKKKGVLSLVFSDLLNKQDFNINFKFLNQDNSNFVNLDNQTIKLGFRYKFGNTTLQTNQRTKYSNERDRLEK